MIETDQFKFTLNQYRQPLMFSVTPHGKERGWVDVDWFHVEK